MGGANLEWADLEGADLENADLEKTNLTNTNLKKTSMKSARLIKSNMAGANLKGAIVDYACIVDVSFTNTIIDDVDFTNTYDTDYHSMSLEESVLRVEHKEKIQRKYIARDREINKKYYARRNMKVPA